MILNKEILEPCFHLLRNVLLEAFQTEVRYYTPPYQDLNLIDLGIRRAIWPDFENRDTSLLPSANHPDRRIFIIRSNLGFYNIIIYLNYESQPDFISIGPFRSEEFSSDYIQKVIKGLNPSASINSMLQTYYESIPSAPLHPVINVMKHILGSFFPETQSWQPVYAEFSGQVNSIHLDTQALQGYSSDFSVSYQESLFNFLEPLTKGQFEAANEALKEYLRLSKILYSRNLNDSQLNLHQLNDFCQMALLATNVHSVHVMKLHLSLRTKISAINSRDALLSMPNDICHKYCLLVKNYAFPEYSKTVRTVVNYIHMHMEEDLTLSTLAKEFGKNASSLSAAFSKEVGMNITNYIHQVRINEAIKLFNTTKLSISEAALAVGFHDFAYFSRLFHKQVGCSPRDYCKSIR